MTIILDQYPFIYKREVFWGVILGNESARIRACHIIEPDCALLFRWPVFYDHTLWLLVTAISTLFALFMRNFYFILFYFL